MKYIVFFMLLFATTATFAELPAGHPSLPDMKKNNQAGPTQLPNKGDVVSTIQSGGYTYIEVDRNGSKEWFAAPQMKLEKGSHIRYSKGLVMSGFYSKTLKRTFDKVLFVGNVEVVKE